jgi:hypothetical protein
MHMKKKAHCPRCKAPLQGYVDECPSCGMEKPLPLPWHVYAIMAVILVAAAWFFVDLESIARAILGVREGVRQM